jgi:hypothetical protein
VRAAGGVRKAPLSKKPIAEDERPRRPVLVSGAEIILSAGEGGRSGDVAVRRIGEAIGAARDQAEDGDDRELAFQSHIDENQ